VRHDVVAVVGLSYTCASLREAIRTIDDFRLVDVNPHAVHGLSFLIEDVLAAGRV
jgi:hypothetical protein